MTPYYDEDGITIFHADCRELLHTFNVAAVVTDPPYGIAGVWKGGFGHGWGQARADSEVRNGWDAHPPDEATFNAILSCAQDCIIWGGNYFKLPVSRGWLVWTKPERGFSLSEAEMAWTNRDNVVRVWDGVRSDFDRQHPTQKPLDLMKWCLGFVRDGRILDPFMGSGTTLRAAKDLGRKAIGIEIEERYCEIAAKRLRQRVLDFSERQA